MTPCANLLKILHMVTSIHWEWVDGDKEFLGVQGRWQLMPYDPKDDGDFWEWHLVNSRQWFDNKSEAVTSLLCGMV